MQLTPISTADIPTIVRTYEKRTKKQKVEGFILYLENDCDPIELENPPLFSTGQGTRYYNEEIDTGELVLSYHVERWWQIIDDEVHTIDATITALSLYEEQGEIELGSRQMEAINKALKNLIE